MNLLPDSQQQEIIDATAGFLAEELPLARLHESEEPVPIARELWQTMAELGWFGLGLPEEQGGTGFTLAEEALLFRELGRVLAPTNVLAASLAAHVAGLAEQSPLAASIIAGDQRVAIAEAADTEAATGDSVAGRFRCIDGSDVELVLCSGPQGFAIVEKQELGQGEVVPCMDEHTHLEIFDVPGAPALAFARAEKDSIRDRGSVLAACMLSGAAEAIRDQATEYAKERRQFGKPIGVFQAIKHKCADMASRCEAATWQTLYAALALRDGHADAGFQASAAKLLAANAATENGRANILVHGGYGVTAEYDAHLFLKRSHVLDLLIGTHGEHLSRVLHEPTAA